MRKLTEEQIARRTKWTEALRSGKYKQGTDCLKSVAGEYCCLGVAYEALDIGFTEKQFAVCDTRANGRDKQAFVSKEGSPSFMSQEVKESLGINTTKKLIQANDVDYKTFTEIADMIDADTKGTKITLWND